MELLVLVIVGVLAFVFLKSLFSGGKKITYTDSSGETRTESLQRRQSRQTLQFEKPDDFEITPEIGNVLDKFENTHNNLFLTGKAGTGKSTLLRYFRATTKKNYAVVAPTGIAAVNVQGQTIHSFFGFYIDITPQTVKPVRADKLQVLRSLETLIIDEISMVRADLLDCIDVSLRLNRRNNLPFGGVQIIAIGDPYQLPPVVTSSQLKYFQTIYPSPHFFSARVYLQANFSTLELTKIYRQEGDNEFINILNSVRNGEVTQNQIDQLNSRAGNSGSQTEAIRLVTTNALAKAINDSEMAKLPGEAKVYKGQLIGNFKEDSTPTDVNLTLKVGAKVMLLNNDKLKKWVNGDLGQIVSLDTNSVRVVFDDNTYDDVGLNEWDKVEFVYDEEERRIVPEVVGKFVQLPIKLAWALTIHKSQGKTYDKVHIDFGTGTFAAGQAYVALSRCTSLEGLSFEGLMLIDDVKTDIDVKKFMGVSEITTTLTPTVTQEIQVNKEIPGKVTKSDLNKLLSFIASPEKYATGSEKATQKVKDAEYNFNLLKDTLDEETKNSFYQALKKYHSRLGR